VPGYGREFGEGHPILGPFIGAEEFTFHGSDWWRQHWEKTKIADIIACYDIEDSHGVWSKGHDKLAWQEFTDADTERDIAFVAMAARKRGALA
jgi:hypothetical protein